MREGIVDNRLGGDTPIDQKIELPASHHDGDPPKQKRGVGGAGAMLLEEEVPEYLSYHHSQMMRMSSNMKTKLFVEFEPRLKIV
jgi:hypothetical protein